MALGFYLSRTAAKEGKKPSILGKMYENFDGIGVGHTVKTMLVSNLPFSFCAGSSCATDLTAIIHEAPVLARGAMFEGPLLLDAHR